MARRAGRSTSGLALLVLAGMASLGPSGALQQAHVRGMASGRLFGTTPRARFPGPSPAVASGDKRSSTALKAAAGALPLPGGRPKLPLAFVSVNMASPLLGSLVGGVLSGGLHAISGPDHLAAILPRCMGQRWFRAARVGAVWGLGHSISSFILGTVAFGIKGGLSGKGALFSRLTHVSEIAVGLSLVGIGVFGLREALAPPESEGDNAAKAGDAHEEEGDVNIDEMLPARSLSSAVPQPKMKSRAVLVNGFLHGLSWDGTPSLAPALAFSTWGYCFSFLFAYCGGTVAAMAAATAAVGEGSLRLSEKMNDPELIPRRLSAVASVIAMALGGGILAKVFLPFW